MHVSYALPGLERATVMVLKHRWLAGGHAPVGEALAQSRQSDRLRGRTDGDTVRRSQR